jgi:cytochrome c556
MGAITMMVRSKVNYDHMADQANALASTAAGVGDVFPTGSEMGDTDALPAIWQQDDDFQMKVAALEKATQEFATVAASGDKAAIGKALGAVGGSCKGCHDDYKQAK